MQSGTEWWLQHTYVVVQISAAVAYICTCMWRFVRDFSQPVGCAFLALSRICFFNTLDKKDAFAHHRGCPDQQYPPLKSLCDPSNMYTRSMPRLATVLDSPMPSSPSFSLY